MKYAIDLEAMVVVNVRPAFAVAPPLDFSDLITPFFETKQPLNFYKSPVNSAIVYYKPKILSDPLQFLPPGMSIGIGDSSEAVTTIQ